MIALPRQMDAPAGGHTLATQQSVMFELLQKQQQQQQLQQHQLAEKQQQQLADRSAAATAPRNLPPEGSQGDQGDGGGVIEV